MSMYSSDTNTIYAIQHRQTGRIYVGRTASLDQRLKAHFLALRSNSHPNELMQSDYNEFGEDYEIFILEEVENKYPLRRDAEHKWMETLGTGDERIGYNSRDPHFRRSGVSIPEISPGIPTPNLIEP